MSLLFLFIKVQAALLWDGWPTGTGSHRHNSTSIRENLHGKGGQEWPVTHHSLVSVHITLSRAAAWSSSLEIMLWEEGCLTRWEYQDLLDQALFSGIVSPAGRICGIWNWGMGRWSGPLVVFHSDPLGSFVLFIPRNLGLSEVEVLY